MKMALAGTFIGEATINTAVVWVALHSFCSKLCNLCWQYPYFTMEKEISQLVFNALKAIQIYKISAKRKNLQDVELTLIIWGILCREIVISLEPNLRWTLDQSVNSSLSGSWFNCGGLTMDKVREHLSQIAKLRFSSIFNKFPNFKKNVGDQFKS